MPRVAWQPTKADLKLIEKMSSKGATQTAICKALNISRTTWTKYKDKCTENGQSGQSIKKAMEAGERARREDILALAEDSLRESIKVRKVIETKTVEGGNENGTFTNTTVTEKELLPNPTILMFALVNATNAEPDKPIRWQSINKVEMKQENNNNDTLKIELVDAD
jgi:hypothetical protein